MSTADFFLKVSSLLADLRKELIDFLESLLKRRKSGMKLRSAVA